MKETEFTSISSILLLYFDENMLTMKVCEQWCEKILQQAGFKLGTTGFTNAQHRFITEITGSSAACQEA